jgi:glutamate synthase (NADPH/NADH) small chain
MPGRNAKYAWSDIDRVEPPKRPVADRIADFSEVSGPYDEATAQEQASRCILCPNPSCVEACPLDSPIPDLMELTSDGQFKEAAELLFASYSIPELASHTCVGGRLCERACVLAGKSDPVPVRAITRFLLDYGWKHGLAEPAVEPAKDRRVAVIGSGIGGLVAADALSRRGYAVTVFDSRQNPGGRVMNGLPGFRVDKELVKRRIELLKQRGLEFRMGVAFGSDVKLARLRHEFDAVFLAFGLADAVPLKVPGAELRGVYQAFQFVTQEVAAAGGPTGPRQPAVNVRGRRVVVLGGGDTAMDALRIAIRQGAADALCICSRDADNLSADAEEFSNAREEGGKFLFLSQPVAVIGNPEGAVAQVRCIRMQADGPAGPGRPGVTPMDGTEFDVPADVVLVAYGFTAPKLPDRDDFARLVVDGRGFIQVNADQMTNFPGVFAGGSIVRGPAPLSEVVRDARRAAAAIDRFLGSPKK